MDRGGFSTQLADSKPQFDVALRVAIPINAPARAQRSLRNSLIRINAFSPSAYAASRHFLSSARSADKNDGVDIHTSADLSVLFNLDNDSNIKTLVKDFTMVAASSRRAGKMDTEASAYVSLGVICDNQGKLGEAIEFYLKYLRICTEIDDEAGCACACNCLGVNYMLMASPPTDVGILHGVKTNHQGQENLSFAIKYHTQHLQIGPDSGGHFVAHSNLGLCYGMAGEVVVSAQHHQNALRIAIKMQTMNGQAIAVGNLGALALKKEDIGTSRTCFEQHLQLVRSLSDSAAEIKAWEMLALLSSMEFNHADALESLIEARQICEQERLLCELMRINSLIGIAKGAIALSDHVDRLAATCMGSEN